MEIAEAIKRYFTGASKDDKVNKFKEYNDIINTSRSEIDNMVKGLNSMVSNADDIKKAASVIIDDANVTADNITIALDNMRFTDSRLSTYMTEFSGKLKVHQESLQKAEKSMVKLITDNPNMASIIMDVKYDNDLEKALKTVFQSYKSGDVSREDAVAAYKTAMENKRTDRKFNTVLDEYLTDNN